MKDNSKVTVHDLLWKKLTRGVTDKLEHEGNVIEKWSPNNLRRMILSPEGVVIQNFITKGTFYSSKINIVEFPVNEETAVELQKKNLTSLLYKDRVFSSIEELVIIPKSPNVSYSLSPKELHSLMSKMNSFKRLACIIVVDKPVSLKEFTQQSLSAMGDKFSLLRDADIQIIKDALKVELSKDWYKHTSLRPQFYTLDREDKELHKYFQEVKEYFSNLEKNPVSVKKKADRVEKEPKSDKTVKWSLNKQAKSLLTVRKHQAMFIENGLFPVFRIKWLSSELDIPIKQLKSGTGVKETDDPKANELLEKLQLLDEEGKTGSEYLIKILTQIITKTTDQYIDYLKKKYPLFGGSVKNNMSSIKFNIQKYAFFQYRESFNLEEVLSEDVENKELYKKKLLNNINLEQNLVEELVTGILFDLEISPKHINLEFHEGYLVGVESDINDLEMLILHDLYIYEHNVNHRMYNSLFSKGVRGSKTYVTGTPVNARLRLLVDLEGDDANEWSKTENLIASIDSCEFKNYVSEYRLSIADKLISMTANKGDSVEENKQLVARTVVEIIDDFESSLDKNIAITHAISKLKGNDNKLGVKGVLSHHSGTVSKLFNTNKEPDNAYSKYIELIIHLFKKGV